MHYTICSTNCRKTIASCRQKRTDRFYLTIHYLFHIVLLCIPLHMYNCMQRLGRHRFQDWDTEKNHIHLCLHQKEDVTDKHVDHFWNHINLCSYSILPIIDCRFCPQSKHTCFTVFSSEACLTCTIVPVYTVHTASTMFAGYVNTLVNIWNGKAPPIRIFFYTLTKELVSSHKNGTDN